MRLTPVTPAAERPRLEDRCKFNSSLGYRVRHNERGGVQEKGKMRRRRKGRKIRRRKRRRSRSRREMERREKRKSESEGKELWPENVVHSV